jgi:hypothetical protein
MSVWQQQRLDDLRQRLADHLAHRAELAADKDAVRRIDAEIAEHCTTIADIERRLVPKRSPRGSNEARNDWKRDRRRFCRQSRAVGDDADKALHGAVAAANP